MSESQTEDSRPGPTASAHDGEGSAIGGNAPPRVQNVPADGPLTQASVEAARQDLVQALLARRKDLAESIVKSLRDEIVDYGSLPALTLSDDVSPTAVATVTDLLETIISDDDGTRELEVIRRSAARRVHQEVSLPSLLQSYRVWGSRVWQALVDEAGTDPVRREAALSLVSSVFDYVDRISVTVAQVYLEEAAGAYRARDVLRADILESLLLGRAISDRARLDVARLNLTHEAAIAVVIVRLSDIAPERLRTEFLRVVQSCRETIASNARVLLGVRESDVICLIRVGRPSDLERLVTAAHELASRSATWRVCVGRPHAGFEGIPRSFREAQEAAVVAAAGRRRRRAVLFSEVMLDRILVHSEYAEDLLEEYMRPLIRYDQQHSTELVDTLRSYVQNDFNLTRTAKNLTISPNTVAYRIKRIGQLSGQDVATSTGIVTLVLALRVLDG